MEGHETLEGKAWSAQSSTHSRLQPEHVGNLRMLGTRGGGQAFGEEEAGPGHRTQAGRALRTQAAGRTWGAHLPSLAVVTAPPAQTRHGGRRRYWQPGSGLGAALVVMGLLTALPSQVEAARQPSPC